ncbi:MAG: glycoside hydrolase family 1 protein [Armatimonadota bacterium]|nr:glycoside hydrolase family 1 protein [Armatimonadota bacterium]MDR7401180.1 glycoside hydrolase family 1 protein [Armatimonadota bacterium]MDR7438005.1 glycoside hydrolase family 1 protein [Armatimonadota bacterium]MDR7471835.1 glycoside hydrolase family 1 protein [Armatimonadota bacterium]MDR7507818.1 glycoside hydrolase family 1 protein [Armatimonadota bacterium]
MRVRGPRVFPPGFIWGTATSAYQVEGYNVHADWWEWEQQPGRIRGGDRSGAACGWWERAEEDFDLAARLHQTGHRLSVEWSRIQPAPGRWEEAAVDRYRRMLRALRERGIEPMVTLHHFTTPQWFARRGGWEAPDAPDLFARFVEQVVPALAEFTSLWCTVNEPMGWVFSAYTAGRWPPGHRSLRRALRAAAGLVRAHAAAYRIIHRVQPHARVGFANYFRLFDPARPRAPDRWAAAVRDRLLNWAFVQAVTEGRVEAFPWRQRFPGAEGTLDFVGVNYYTRDLVAFDPRYPRRLFGRHFHPPGCEMSDGGYGEVYPQGLYRVVRSCARLGLPVYVTENGIPDADDDQRPRFIVRHLAWLWRALQDGVPVRGYYYWSLVDNFEWAEGWSLKFGLVAVDPLTQARTVRPSAWVYAQICREGALSEDLLRRWATPSD